MKIIDLYGYLNDNLGDDLMFYILLKRYPNITFKYVDYWKKYEKFCRYNNFLTNESIYEKYGRINHIINLLTFNKTKNRFINNKLKKNVFASICVAGSIFIQRDGYDNRMKYENNKLNNGPLLFIGANFGPYKDEAFMINYKNFFKKCYSVTFRDKASYNLFSDLKNVHLASDIILSNFELPAENLNYKDYVVISVIDILKKGFNDKCYENYVCFLKNIVSSCIKNNKTPCFVSFCKNEGDADFIKILLNEFTDSEKQNIKVKEYESDIEDFLSLFRSCYGVIATRFHAMILSLKFNKPFFALSYSNKTENYCNDNNLNTYCNIDKLELCNYSKIACEFFNSSDIKYNIKFRDPFEEFDSFLLNNYY